MTLAYFPFVFLPVAAALRGLDPAWEEQARTLGLRPAAVFAPGGAAAAAAGDPRRRAAGRAALPVRVRGVQHAAVRHLHHRDLRPVLVELRQRRGQHAGRWCWWSAAWSWWARQALLSGRAGIPGSGRRSARAGDRSGRAGSAAGPGGSCSWRCWCGAALAVPLSSVAYWLSRGSDSWPQALETSLTTIGLAGDGRRRHCAGRVPGGLPGGPVPQPAAPC